MNLNRGTICRQRQFANIKKIQKPHPRPIIRQLLIIQLHQVDTLLNKVCSKWLTSAPNTSVHTDNYAEMHCAIHALKMVQKLSVRRRTLDTPREHHIGDVAKALSQTSQLSKRQQGIIMT